MKSRSVGWLGHEYGDRVCIVGSGLVVEIEAIVLHSARLGRLFWRRSCSTADLRRSIVDEACDFHLGGVIRRTDWTTILGRRRLTLHLRP